MWHLKSICANNLCSFLELEYCLKQGEATLIFGNNHDSDSQNSNGSGKSALIEAIAIALTGDPLRKVNVDEIINDSQSEATISAVLFNDMLGEQMTINRRLSRKQPQIIQILRQTGAFDTDTEEVIQATVADYNKYILDQLGLSKDDIFGNFILTARKYKSFLASSDKEKKEIINRFSNGVLVDKAIEALQSDMTPIQNELFRAEKNVAACTGRVEALAHEIEKTVNESEERKQTNESRIKSWEEMIAIKHSDIRKAQEEIVKIGDCLDCLDNLDADIQALEKQDGDATAVLPVIKEKLGKNSLALTTDYDHEIESVRDQIERAGGIVDVANHNIQTLRKTLEVEHADHKAAVTSLNEQKKVNEANRNACANRIAKLASSVKNLQHKSEKLEDAQAAKRKEKSGLEKQLAGVIMCPKCKHEFTFDGLTDIAEARKSLSALQSELTHIAKEIEANEAAYRKTVSEGRNQREIETALNNEQRTIAQGFHEAECRLQAVREQYDACERQIVSSKEHLTQLLDKASKIRKHIFDEVFDVIDEAYRHNEGRIKSIHDDIETFKGTINSYEKAIEEARKVSDEDILASLKKSRDEYRATLQQANEEKNIIEVKLNELKAQEATFIEFKTYLANTKIAAIAQITNEFLETIGSDIRVALSGYTILKSGKVRDKISVSLLRDGVDCGSFEKFSAGERVRVELASILSMNQLTNLNCEDGKGLDLLIADEVLDSADELGLASVFKALNKTQLTSLVVSHGNIQEGYPNKITIVKQNGVSSIHDSQQTD